MGEAMLRMAIAATGVGLVVVALSGCPGSGEETTSRAGGAGPAQTLRTYLRHLDEERYQASWRLLSPEMREEVGGLENWTGIYPTGRQTHLISLRTVSRSADTADFRTRTEIVDPPKCRSLGDIQGEWSLVRRREEWLIDDAFTSLREVGYVGCKP